MVEARRGPPSRGGDLEPATANGAGKSDANAAKNDLLVHVFTFFGGAATHANHRPRSGGSPLLLHATSTRLALLASADRQPHALNQRLDLLPTSGSRIKDAARVALRPSISTCLARAQAHHMAEDFHVHAKCSIVSRTQFVLTA